MRNSSPLSVRLSGDTIFVMKTVCVFGVFCVLCLPALADTAFPHGTQVAVGASLTGGIHLSAGYYNSEWSDFWRRHFGMRIGFASTNPLKSAIDSAIDSVMRDGIDVGNGVKIDNGQLDVWHVSMLLDYHPFAGVWRITGGYAWGGMQLDSDIFGKIEQAPSQRFYFYLAGDHYYYNGNDFGGIATIDWNFHGPYLGTGFDWRIGCGFGVFIDFGVVFTSRAPHLSLNIPHEQLYIYSKQTQTWAPVTIPTLDNDVVRATHDANRKLSDFRFYPVVKLGFSYHF